MVYFYYFLNITIRKKKVPKKKKNGRQVSLPEVLYDCALLLELGFGSPCSWIWQASTIDYPSSTFIKPLLDSVTRSSLQRPHSFSAPRYTTFMYNTKSSIYVLRGVCACLRTYVRTYIYIYILSLKFSSWVILVNKFILVRLGDSKNCHFITPLDIRD